MAIYNPAENLSIEITREDNNESYSLTGFAKNEFVTVEKQGNPQITLNTGIYQGVTSFGVDPSNEIRATIMIIKGHRDNLFFTELANNRIIFRFDLSMDVGPTRESVLVPRAMVEEIYLPTINTDVSDLNSTWSIIGGHADTGWVNNV